MKDLVACVFQYFNKKKAMINISEVKVTTNSHSNSNSQSEILISKFTCGL